MPATARPRSPDLLHETGPIVGTEWRCGQARAVKQRRLRIRLPRVADLFRIRNRTGGNNNSVAFDSSGSPIPFAVVARDGKLARFSAFRRQTSLDVIEVETDRAGHPI